MRDFYPPQINLPTGVEMLLEQKDHSSECPTCHQQTFLRPLTLNKRVLRALWLAMERPVITSREVHDEIGKTAYANYTQLKHWGFLKEIEAAKWSITTEGQEFLAGRLRVPEIVWVYNDHARIVPVEMQGRMVLYADLDPMKEMSREIAASESVPLDASRQDTLV